MYILIRFVTFSNVVFYLERLQNKEPITTHVITIPRRNNGDERKLASGGIDC